MTEEQAENAVLALDHLAMATDALDVARHFAELAGLLEGQALKDIQELIATLREMLRGMM